MFCHIAPNKTMTSMVVLEKNVNKEYEYLNHSLNNDS